MMGIFTVALLFSYSVLVASAPNIQDALLITPAPAGPTHCPSPNVLKRQLSCQYGQCGDTCLIQGAFCCGPAGTLATSPYWMCDNGACITSVRGTTGIVDCYDPDNPSGTTQSCVDHGATTCNPTDRCYTCEATEPYCRWETWIDTPSNSPTLKWFSCQESKIPDATFFASDITIPSQTSHSTASSTKTSSSGNSPPLSAGAIIGIAVGGGIAVVGCVATLAYYCLKRGKETPTGCQELSTDFQNKPPPPPQMAYQPPVELDSHQQERDRSELGSMTAYSPHSQTTTPFVPPGGYGQNVEQVDLWRRGMETVELPVKRPSYMERPAPVYDDNQNPRDSWGHGDDAGHMSPAR